MNRIFPPRLLLMGVFVFVCQLLFGSNPIMQSMVKVSDTQLNLYFNESVQISGTYSSGFTLQDCQGFVYTVQSVSDGIAGDQILELTVADLSTANGDLSLTYFNIDDPISDLQGNIFDTDATGVIRYSEDHFEVDNIAYANKSINTGGDPVSFAFNNDGTKLYVLENAGSVVAYNLSSPYDLSTNTASGNSLTIQSSMSPLDLIFNNDGSKLFIADFSAEAIIEYSLSTNFDLASAAFSSSYPTPSSLRPTSIAFDQSGLNFYLMDETDYIRQFPLAASFDLSALPASLPSGTPAFFTNLNVAISFAFNHDGTRLYTIDRGIRGVNQFDLSVPYDITTTGTGKSTSVSSPVGADAGGILFRPDGSEFYAAGPLNNNSIYQFSVAFVDGPVMSSIAKASDNELKVYFDKEVSVLEAFPNNFTVLKDGVAVAVDGIANGTPGDNEISLLFSSPNDLAGVTTDIVVTYADATGNEEVRDLACNAMADDPTGQTLLVETTPPTLTSIELISNTELLLTFDEAVQAIGSNASNFEVTNCRGTILVATAITDAVPSDNELTVIVPDVELSNAPLTINYTDPGNGAVSDLNGNALANFSQVLAAADPFDIFEATYAGAARDFDFVTTGNATSVTFDNSGLKMYVATDGISIYQYDLSVPYDPFTATQVGLASGLEGSSVIFSLKVSPTGDRITYTTVTSVGFRIIEYTLSTPFDLNTIGATPVLHSFSEATDPSSFAFSDVGDKLFVAQNNNSVIYEYVLSTNFDISTSTYTNHSIATNPSNGIIVEIDIVNSGDQLIVGHLQAKLVEIDLVNPNSLNGAIINSSEVSVAQTSTVSGMEFKNDGTGFFLTYISPGNGRMYQYDILDGEAPFLTSFDKISATTLRLNYSEPVTAYELNPGNFTISDGTASIQPTSVVNGALGDSTLFLSFSSALPSGQLTLTYDNSSANDEVADISCNPAATDPTGVTETFEAVPPEVNVVSRVGADMLEVLFSEPVRVSNLFGVANVSVQDCEGNGISVLSVSDGTPEDSKLMIETDVLTSIDGAITVTITSPSNEIMDLSANNLLNGSATNTVGVYRPSEAVYNNVQLEFGSTFTFPAAISFDDSGSNMYVVGLDVDELRRYELTVPFDISTASITSDVMDLSIEFDVPVGIEFNPTGTMMYLTGVPASGKTDYVNQYVLSTPFDITTATLNGGYDSNTGVGEDIPLATRFNSDGSKMFIIGTRNDLIYEFSLSTNYNITTLTYVGSAEAFNFSANATTDVVSFDFDPSGSLMYVQAQGARKIIEYQLSTPFDVSTAVHSGIANELLFTTASIPRGFTFSKTGERLFIIETGIDRVLQLDILDTSAPTFSSVEIVSQNQIDILFDEVVKILGSNPADFLIVDQGGSGNSLTVTSIQDGTPGDERISLFVDISSAVGDMEITYSDSNEEVSDLSCNRLPSGILGILDVTPPAAPTITGISDDNGISNMDGITNDQTLIVEGSAEPNSTINVFVDGSLTGLGAVTDGAGIFNFNFNNVPDGSYLLTVTATDAAGNGSGQSQVFSITVDTNSPTVSSITKNQTGKLDASVTNADYTVLFSESVNGIDVTDFEVVLTGTATGQVGTITSVSSNEVTVEITGISGEGTIGLNLRDDDSIEDTAGNVLGGAGTVNGDFTGEVYETKASQTITFSDPSGTYGDVITLSATASSSLPVSYSLISGPAILSGDQLTITGVGAIEVEASQAGDADFNAATAVAKTFTPGKVTLTTTADDQTITFGDALPGFTVTYSGFIGSDAIADLDVVPTATSTATATSDAGTYPITASGGSDGNYDFSYQDGTLTINQASQTITFDAIADIDFANTDMVSLTATASSGLAVDFTLTQGDGSISGTTLTANATGVFTVEATQAGNTNYSAASNVSQTFNVNDSRKTDQTITFDALTDKTYGDAPFSLSASASSSLPVTFSATGPVSINGSDVTITGAGLVTITASQVGDATFNPAASVNQTFVVSTATLTVTPDDQQITFGEVIPTLTVTYSGFVGSDAIVDLDSEPTLSTQATSSSDVGTYDITASGGSDDNYAYSYLIGTLTIEQADQTITFDPIADIDLANNSTINLSASASSSLGVSFTLITGDGVINGNVLAVNATGNFIVEAAQSGNNNFNAASEVTQSFQVFDSRKMDQTITFSTINEQEYGDQLTLGATASSSLPVSYTLNSGTGTISNGVLTIEGTGTYEITASQNGDNSFNPATDVTQQFNVVKATLTATADDQSILEGDIVPTLTITYSGFKLSDDVTTLDTPPTVSTQATDQSPAGDYDIVLTGGSDAMYDLSLVNGILTIEEVLGVNSKTVRVYPNPVSTYLNVIGTDYDEVRIFNLHGKMLKESTSSSITIRDFTAGIYVVKIYREEVMVHQQKIKIN